jgi:hypothetical protein
MEGADTWMIDPATPLHPYFHIVGVRNGWGDTDEILGQTGTFTEGMTFNYTGDNAFMDQIDPDSLSFSIFADTNSNVGGFDYFNGVVYDNGFCTYKTVGVSFEFGGLVDGISPNTKTDLADSIMSFFCIPKPSFTWDIAPLSIIEPGQYTPPNVSILPVANVRNFGNNVSTFAITCRITPGFYNSTRIVTLDPDSTVQVTFMDPWNPGGTVGQQYNVCVWTIFGPDQNPLNDTLCKMVTVWDNRWFIQSGYTETVPVTDGFIDASEWGDATRRDVSDFLGMGSSPKPPGSAHLYVMNDDTTLYLALDAFADGSFTAPGDQFDLYFEDNHDGNWPTQPDSSEGELLINVNSRPQNTLIDFRPMFDVFPGIPHQVNTDGWVETTSGHMQYEVVLPLGVLYPDYNLNALPCDTVGFWLAAADYGSMTGYAWWPSSSNVGFGSLSDMGDLILACIPPIDTTHDGGVISISWPPDTVCMNTPFVPQAWVRNYGNVTEDSFGIYCTIDGPGGSYGDTAIISIMPDDSQRVDFKIWTVSLPPPDSIFYTMDVWTEVSGDTIPINDSTSAQIFAYDCLPPGVEERTDFSKIPKVFGLFQSRPNPTASIARIRYDLPARSRVRLVVYDITGRKVRVLVDGTEEAGYRSIVWDGRDKGGRDAASGIYFYKMRANSSQGNSHFEATGKMVLLQ